MKKLFLFIGGVLIIVVAWYLASPLFIDNVVDEPLPFSTMTESEYQEMVEAAKDVGMTFPKFADMKRMTQDQMKAFEQELGEVARQKPDNVMDEEFPIEPVSLAEGVFVNADDFHTGSGTATLFRLTDGSHLLRFENFSVTNGPDLRVYLSKDSSVSEAVELGKLKGNKGSQNYEIPEQIDLSQYRYVIIYCKPFHVTFATAKLTGL